MRISKKEIEKIRKLIYRKTGIYYDDSRIHILRKRVQNRINKTSPTSFDAYYRTLVININNEIDYLIEELTVNESYFFREYNLWKNFSEKILPLVLKTKRQGGNYNLKLWSAGCATGEEAYTLSIVLREMIKDFEKWKIYILASDIDRQVLEYAKRAIYSERAIKDTPFIYLHRYFFSREGNKWQLNWIIKNMVDFQLINLFDSTLMGLQKNFDFIFCRNVLIYFDRQSIQKVINFFYDSLNPGGYIFLGASEFLNTMIEDNKFEFVKFDDFICYKKPELIK